MDLKKINNANGFSPLPKPVPLTEQSWPDGTVPLVTTRTAAYNHESTIRECLEGILIQETTFPVQVLVHDDASTDNTPTILKEYEARYPNLVRVFYQPKNTHSDPNKQKLRAEFASWIRGKYLALCEGDDYWTSKSKLQVQASFLEENPDYVLTFHNAVVVYADGDRWRARHRYTDFNWCQIRLDRDTYSGDDFLSDLHPPTPSVVYRQSDPVNRVENWQYSVPSGDIPLYSKVVGEGKAKFFNWDACVYRKHVGGVTAGHRGDYIHVGRIVTYLGLFSYHKGKFAGVTAATIRKHLREISDVDSLRKHPFSQKLFREIEPYADALETGHALREVYHDLGVLLGEKTPLQFKSDAVFVIHGPNQVNGPNVWLMRLLPELVRRGLRITVLAFMAEGQRCQIVQQLEIAGVRVDVLKPMHTEDSVRQILGYLKQHPTQVFVPNLNVPAYFASSWIREAGVPAVGVLHSDDDFHHDLEEEFLLGKQGKYLSACVVVSKQQQERISKLDTTGSEMILAPYGAPIREDSCQYSENPFRCLYVGRLRDQQKRVTDMVAGMVPVMRQFPQVEFHLCGEGDARVQLEKLIADAGLSGRIRIHGNLSQDALRKLSLECQAFLLLSDYEGIPIALMEAMACGLVPICTDIRSGIPELITDGVEGLIIKDRGPGLEQALTRLLRDPEGWQQMSDAARAKIVASYSSERNAEIWLNLLKRLAEQNAGSRKAIDIPNVVELPPKRSNPLGMAREDHRKPTAETAFTEPPLITNNADLYWQRQSILEAIRSAKPVFDGVFLDVGCGIMPYKTLLTGQGSQIERYIGLDIETEIYNADVDLRWDGQKIPLDDDSIDSAMATEVLEHCPEPLVVLKEIRRVLKPGGVFFFTVPYIWPLHDAPYDFYRYTPFSLKKLLLEAGFDSADVKALSGWDASLAQMMGLWLKRAPMSNERRNAMAQKLWPLYQELVQTDQLPADSEAGNTMATGWRGIAFKPAAQAPVEEIATTELPIIIVRSHKHNYSETFIEDHVDHISRKRILIYGWPLPRFDESGRSVLEAGLEQTIATTLRTNQLLTPELQQSYHQGIAQFIKKSGAKVALLESGLMGAMWFEACLLAELPYVIHIHGVDAFGSDILNNYAPVYRRMFSKAAAVVAVSLEMVEQLKSLGADPARLVHGPYGVSVQLERIAAPAEAKPVFIAVGRFVDKKSPQNTLRAFAAIHKKVPEARLIMVGDGPLLEPCRRWVQEKNLGDAVTFAGVQSRQAVSRLMSLSRVFVQHSVCAENGDREGLPLAILEAGAHGLPVVATRHAGIPDAIREGKDGFLVDEGDALGMAKAMLKLVGQPKLAGQMGASFRERVTSRYSRAIAIQRLQSLLREVMAKAKDSPKRQSSVSDTAAKPSRGTPAAKPESSAPASLEAQLKHVATAAAAWSLVQQADQAGQAELAFAASETAVSLDRNCAPAYLQMGQQLVQAQRYEEAYLCMKEAARVGQLSGPAQQILQSMESNPALQTEMIQAYRARIEAAAYTPTDRPRRILVFTNLLPPQEMGGFGRSVWELCEGLLQRGHKLCILTADVKELERTAYPNHQRVEQFVQRKLRLFGHWERGIAVGLTDPDEIRSIAFYNVDVILKAIEQFKPDVCMAGNLDFLSGAMLEPILSKKIPIVHRLGNEVPGYPVAMLPKSELYCIAGCTNWVNARLQQAGYAAKRFACLPPGSPLEEYYRLFMPRTDRLRLCYAGLMMAYKGPHLILEALKLLKQLKIPFTCEFAGDFKDPKFAGQFKQLIRQWDLSREVRLLGFCDRSELAAMYARSNVLVMPSIFEEPFGKVQIEAQAAGLAVVRTPVGGYEDMLEDEVNGLLFKRQDAEDLARQLYVLQKNPDFWQRLAAQGQADAFRFTTRNSVQILEQLFEELLELATD